METGGGPDLAHRHSFTSFYWFTFRVSLYFIYKILRKADVIEHYLIDSRPSGKHFICIISCNCQKILYDMDTITECETESLQELQWLVQGRI